MLIFVVLCTTRFLIHFQIKQKPNLEGFLRLFLLNRLASFALQSFLLSLALPSISTLVAEAFSQIKKKKKNRGKAAKQPWWNRGLESFTRAHTCTCTLTHKHTQEARATDCGLTTPKTNLFARDVAPDMSLHPTRLQSLLCAVSLGEH